MAGKNDNMEGTIMNVMKNIFSGVVTMLAVLAVFTFFGQIVTFLGTIAGVVLALALFAVLGNFVLKLFAPVNEEEEADEDTTKED